MERLTVKWIGSKNTEVKGVEGMTCNTVCKKADGCSGCPINAVINKLAEYEELEEKGLLLRLPFKVGDKAYCVGTKCLSGLYEDVCEQVYAVNECDICPLNEMYMVFEREVTKDLLEVLVNNTSELFVMNETVFRTREEAEAALALRVRK